MLLWNKEIDNAELKRLLLLEGGATPLMGWYIWGIEIKHMESKHIKSEPLAQWSTLTPNKNKVSGSSHKKCKRMQIYKNTISGELRYELRSRGD